MDRAVERWNDFWFRPAGPMSLVAARAVVALHALWIVLSRPGLAGVLDWPHAFWSQVPDIVRWRFLMFDALRPAEPVLYGVLIAALVASAVGLAPRVSSFAAALLLYHFAPLESVFSVHTGPHFRGLTIPILALFVFSFAPSPQRGAAPGPEHRWPVALVQLELCLIYVMAGIAKLHKVGWDWASGANFQGLVLSMALPEGTPPWAALVAGSPALCALGGLGGLVMDFAPLLLLSRWRAAKLVIPLLVVSHLAIAGIFHVLFLSTPLLLLFVDWDRVLARAVQGGVRVDSPAAGR